MASFTFLLKIGHSIALMRFLFKIQTEHKIHFRSHSGDWFSRSNYADSVEKENFYA